MEVGYAYTMDIQPFSQFPHEEEELITPGICFIVQRADFDAPTNKHMFYLKLEHRFNSKYKRCFYNFFCEVTSLISKS